MQKENPQAVPEQDRFLAFVEKTLTTARENKTQVTLGVAGVVLFLAIVTGVGLYRQNAVRSASLAFQSLKSDFQALEAREGREIALQRWLGDAPAALNGMKGGAATYDAALLWYGGLAFENGDFESASAWYGAAANGFDSGSSLRSIAWCGQGQALEQVGKTDEAAAAYEKIRSAGVAVKREEATFLLARIKETRGDSEGAEALYREILENPSPSVYKNLASEKVPGL
ncbi:tetratricopeptide repeat protein [Desulfoluna spongiiphila]|uniref:Tetratricopeptide repeat-containing protein n=1 Tax=Desulfoluna spongiiphila TaxID=419481 RepID=A0A1G5I380_9BACT|nr:tetratricopeptide repeat protein [Desulfoluna spongiiphila]SCY70512.1 Tetratricopeptide repeat-containing protein [Desulfoluna spongiiphila]